MAVTSIWPIKGRIKSVIDYARNPEKTTAEGLVKQSSLHVIDGVVEYAADELKTEERRYVTAINCQEETAAQQFMETKNYWSRVRQTNITGGRVCYHGYQSFAPGEVTAEIAHKIGVELATRLWGDRFEVIVATHCNTDCFHNHFVLNSVSQADGLKFDNRRSDYLAMREMSDRLCLKYGLSLVETEPPGRKRNHGEYLAEQNGKPTVRSLIKQDIDEAIKASVTTEEFFARLKEKGYEIKLRSDAGTILKYPSIRPPEAKGFFRFHKLGKGYDLDNILEQVTDNYRRQMPFPEEAQKELRRYRERTAPKEKSKGFHALYIRYCYELHILVKFPASVKRVSSFMREDLTRMQKLDEQTRLLAENRIETREDMDVFRGRQMGDIEDLTQKRSELRNELKRVQRKGDSEAALDIKAHISDLSARIKKKKRWLFLCDCIEARSAPMEQALAELEEQQKTQEKEESVNEQLLGRSSRAGREDVSGRRGGGR
ncbi:MAG: relaxase/mobilization nuclease domain-containing protein [Oscillospiraceae bacterium]|nr:relaxase/mobilization nuclease domain-containing protein [Oscillospiraceae bacterium]